MSEEEQAPRSTPEEVLTLKQLIAMCSTQMWEVLERAGFDPTDIIVYCSAGMIFGIGSKAAGKSKETFLLACEDIFDNAETYEAELEQGEESEDEQA